MSEVIIAYDVQMSTVSDMAQPLHPARLVASGGSVKVWAVAIDSHLFNFVTSFDPIDQLVHKDISAVMPNW